MNTQPIQPSSSSNSPAVDQTETAASASSAWLSQSLDTRVERAREVIAESFAILDAAAVNAPRDGLVVAADLLSALDGSALTDAARADIKNILSDADVLRSLDARDGADSCIRYTALVNPVGSEQKLQNVNDLVEIPSVSSAQYSDAFVKLKDDIASGSVDLSSATLAWSDGAILDAADGTINSVIDPQKLSFATNGAASTALPDGVLGAAVKGAVDSLKNSPPLSLPDGVNRETAEAGLLAVYDNMSVIAGGSDKFTVDQIKAAGGSLNSQDAAAINSLFADPAAAAWFSQFADANGFFTAAALQAPVSTYELANAGDIMSAAALAAGGVKTSSSPDLFKTDISPQFIADSVLDVPAVNLAYARLMNTPAFKDVIRQQLGQVVPDIAVRAEILYDTVSSAGYYQDLQYLEQTGRGDAAAGRVSEDLYVLSLLAPDRVEEAAGVVVQRSMLHDVQSSTPANTSESDVVAATSDSIQHIVDILKGARGGVRLPGLLAGHDVGWAKLAESLSFLKDWPAARLNELASALGRLIKNSDGSSAGVLEVGAAEISAAQAAAAGASAAERPALQAAVGRLQSGFLNVKRVVGALEVQRGAWASLAGAVSVASGIYKLTGGADKFGDTAWGRLSAANDFVVALCFTPGYIALGNTVAGSLGSGFKPAEWGLVPSQKFSELIKFSAGRPAAGIAVTVGEAELAPSRLSAAVGAAAKGLTGFSLIAAGSINSALGIKQIIDSSGSGNKFGIAAGSMSLATGVAWAGAGAAFLLGSAVAGPLIAVGVITGIVGAFLGLFGPSARDKLVDSIGEAGRLQGGRLLKEGWSDAVRTWWDQNVQYPTDSGIGLDM